MVASALNHIQPDTNESSNDFSSTKSNADISIITKTLDNKATISTAVKRLTESKIATGSHGNDYREIKTEITEHNNDVENISNNGTAETSSSLDTTAEGVGSYLSPKEKISPKKRKCLKQDAPNIRMKGRKAKGKALMQMKRMKKHSYEAQEKSEKSGSKMKSKNKNCKKPILLKKKQASHSAENGSEMNVKEENPSENDIEDTDDKDIKCSPKLNQDISENHRKGDERTPKSSESTIEKVYKCSYCDRLFTRTYHCRKHFDTHKRRGVDKSTLKIIDTRLGRYKCQFCEEPFIYHSQLKEHLLKEHPEYKPYKCDSCDLSFNEKQKLTYHKHYHTLKICCEKCGRRFPSKSSLKIHMHAHNDRNLPCRYCDMMFKSPITRKNHIKALHLAKGLPVVRNHICELCGHAFKRMFQLKCHLLMHTGERPWKCETCGKSYARKDLLVMHQKSHVDVKCYNCNVCNKSFTLRCYLMRHLQIHNAEKQLFNCVHCGRTFTRTDNLRTHLRLHSGDKPYKCETCGKSYTQAVSLAQHMNTHKLNFTVN